MAGEAPILPGLSLIGVGKDALIDARPRTAEHVEHGTYGDVFRGWRGQFGLARQGLAAEVNASRLDKATGEALTENASSNYDVQRLADPTKAIGELFLQRFVVHVRAFDAVFTAADATDGGTAATLLTAIAEVMNDHIADVYDPSTGLGSHQVDDQSGTFVVSGSSWASPPVLMGDLVNTAIDFLTKTNRHFLNRQVSDGAALEIHIDTDSTNRVTLATAMTASIPGGSFSAAPKAEQQTLLVGLNTMKRAIIAHFALEAMGGTVRAGLKVSIAPSDATAAKLISSSEFVVALDTYVSPGTQQAIIPLVSTLFGAQSNLQQFSFTTQQITVQGDLFDAGAALPFTPGLIRAAGGGLGQSDTILRGAAAASWIGIYGPTRTAMLAGCLRSSGAAHFAELDDPATGKAWIYVTDESWAQSHAWQATVEQTLRDGWLGVGQKIVLTLAFVLNEVVRVRLTVKLRDKAFITDPSSTTDALQKAIRSYFDDRPDWYIWKLASLRGVCTAADKKRILQVSSLVVIDRNGEPLSEPTVPNAGDALTHWLFADNGLEVTYVAPS